MFTLHVVSVAMEKDRSQYILIVDDSPEQRFLLKTLLEAKGYSTECTANGDEALVLLRTNKDKPQMILLDLNMPMMGGFAFRSLQQKDPRLRDIPTVIMSGEEDTHAISDKTKTEVIKKPVSIVNLLKTVEKKLCAPNKTQAHSPHTLITHSNRLLKLHLYKM